MTKDASVKFLGGEYGCASSVQDGKKMRRKAPKESFEAPALFDVVCTYIGYAVLFIFGHLADFWRRIGLKKDGGNASAKDVSQGSYCKITISFKNATISKYSDFNCMHWFTGLRSATATL